MDRSLALFRHMAHSISTVETSTIGPKQLRTYIVYLFSHTFRVTFQSLHMSGAVEAALQADSLPHPRTWSEVEWANKRAYQCIKRIRRMPRLLPIYLRIPSQTDQAPVSKITTRVTSPCLVNTSAMEASQRACKGDSSLNHLPMNSRESDLERDNIDKS